MTEKPFLDRWAARKAAARKSEDAATADAEPDSAPPAAADPPGAHPPAPPEPISDDELAALPPVETLGADSDIRAFLRPGVPAALKNAALRRMWMLTPAIRDHKDIAVDYAWDWNTPGGVPGDGGRIDPARVAEWVHDLSRPRAAPPDRRPAPEASDTEPAREAETAPDTPTAPRTPPAPQTAATARDGESEAAAPPRPRHGGARPG